MTQIKLRRDTSANFTSKNPVLGVGEPAYETDTKKLKIGDGATAYTQLEYFSAGGGTGDVPIATTTTAGKVKPDGTTITITDDGTISAVGGGSADSYTKSETDALLSEKNDNIFDISKFTVVGNPTITDDGIASGFSAGNYIKIPSEWAKNVTNFKIKGKFKVENSVQGSNSILGYVTADYSMGLSFSSTSIQWFAIKTSSEEVNLYQKYSITPNIDYSYELQLNNNLYTFRLFDDTGSAVVNLSKSTSSPFSITSNYLRLGVSGNYNPLGPMVGSIDLKQFSITVDGEEVFNGLMESTKPIYDKITNTNTTLSTFQTDTDNNFSAVNSALNEKANLSDLTLKQNLLVSGTNIKTINGKTILGEGDITVGGGSGLEICDIGMALYVDETKGLRRYLNGQIVDINTNTQAFLNRLKQITTLHPSLLCTEDEWQTAKTMSAFGQVGKFVFNYSGENIVSVRLPRVVNVQGLFDLQNLGMTVRESLPNIQGGVIGYILGNYASDSDTAITFTGALEGESIYTGTIQSGSNHFQAIRNLSIDANKSSPTYQDNAPVQPEAIQYPYFIQIATGSETENNIINEIELNNPYSLFDSKYSDHELNNLSWLKSQGQWNAKAVYPTAYDELLKEYNNPDRLATFNKDAFNVVGSPTITDDGVAGGWSEENYITIPDLKLQNAKTWKIEGVVDIKSAQTEGVPCWLSIVQGNGLMLPIWSDDTYVKFQLYLSSSTSGWNIANTESSGVLLSEGSTFKCELEFSGTQYIYTIYQVATGRKVAVLTADSSDKVYQSPTRLGIKRNMYPMASDNTIDLNAFKIYVDGKRVFSGAKSKVKLSTETYTDYDFVLNTADETFRLPLLDGSENLIGDKYTNYEIGASGQEYTATYNGYVSVTKSVGKGTVNLYNSTQGHINTTCFQFYATTESIVKASIKVNKGDKFIFQYTAPTTNNYSLMTLRHNKGNGSLYYYVGETVQNANLIDAGRIEEQLANKVDTSNTQWATNACMPDYSAGINISVPTQSAPYICQYDCYMQGIAKKAYYSGFYAYINGTQYILGAGNNTNMVQSNNINLFLPKGTSIYFNNGFVMADSLYVFPLKGVE